MKSMYIYFSFAVFGQVASAHIFTFDGKYLNLPANCKYLLARDAVNGNFTIVGTWTNGRISAITLADHHDSITANSNGKVTLNNGKSNFMVFISILLLFSK